MARSHNSKPTRKERERERHRHEILEAAERVFVRKGYYLATVEEIAEEAEFAVGTIYNFFESKEDLYARVVEQIGRSFMDAFEQEVLTKSDPQKAIGTLIELRLTHFEEHRGFVRVFFETTPGSRFDHAGALPPSCAALYEQYIETVSELFQRGIKEGCFDKLDPLYLTLCLEGIVNAFMAYWSRRPPSEPLTVRVEKMKHAFLSRLQFVPSDSDNPRGERT